MDDNMNAMNQEINFIQEAISHELLAMRIGVDDLSVHLERLNMSFALMNTTLNHMDTSMYAWATMCTMAPTPLPHP
jgi:hypothetical protein